MISLAATEILLWWSGSGVLAGRMTSGGTTPMGMGIGIRGWEVRLDEDLEVLSREGVFAVAGRRLASMAWLTSLASS